MNANIPERHVSDRVNYSAGNDGASLAGHVLRGLRRDRRTQDDQEHRNEGCGNMRFCNSLRQTMHP